jgi:hypothetical protein
MTCLRGGNIVLFLTLFGGVLERVPFLSILGVDFNIIFSNTSGRRLCGGKHVARAPRQIQEPVTVRCDASWPEGRRVPDAMPPRKSSRQDARAKPEDIFGCFRGCRASNSRVTNPVVSRTPLESGAIERESRVDENHPDRGKLR